MIFRESCHKRVNLQHIPSETAEHLYYYVLWTGHFLCKSDFHIRRANYNTYLLLYTVSGEGTLRYEDRNYTLGRDSLMLIDCRKLQEYFPNGDGWEFKYIHFKGALSARYYTYISRLYGSPVSAGGTRAGEYLDRILESVRTSGAEEICSELIYRLLTGMISAHRGRDVIGADPIGAAVGYISEHYGENITVSELAEIAHISRCHFSVRFKAYTGFSPHRYLLLYRLGYAKRLLCDTTDSIGEIADRCGFSDVSSFIRAFRLAEGISPASYRNSQIGS